MANPRELPRRLHWWLSISDPGRVRVRDAWAAALSVCLAIVAMALTSIVLEQKLDTITVSGFMAMQGALMVKDRTLREREITTALLLAPAIAGVSVAAVLNAHWLAEDVGLVLAVFVAVWVRRFGPRGTALGMVGFFGYFFGLLTHATVDALPMLILAIAVGVASSLLVRVAIIRERPRLQLQRLSSSLRVASRAVLDAALAADRSSPRRLHAQLDRLGETAMAVDDWQDRFRTARHVDVSAGELSARVFEAQISMEQAASALWEQDPSFPPPAPLRDSVAALRAVLARSVSADQVASARASVDAARDDADGTGPAGVAVTAVRHAVHAQAAIHAIRPLPASAHWPVGRESAAGKGMAGRGMAGQGAAADNGPTRWWHARQWDPATRAAIQAAIAAAIATVLGDLISADRWYWAVLSSFMIFYSTTTRGGILTKAWRRVFGTILGVAGALLVVVLIGHHPVVQLALLVVCVFLALYFGPLSYTLLTFFSTILLATAYELLGVLNLKILEWRVEETIAGAAVGIAASYFVLSTRSHPVLLGTIRAYLGVLDTLIARCADAVLRPGHEEELLLISRELDGALAEVVEAAEPLRVVGSPQHRRDARKWERQLKLNSRSAHELARAGVLAQDEDESSGPSRATADAFRRAAEHVRQNVAVAVGQIDGERVSEPDLETETVVMNVLETLPPHEDAEGTLRGAVRGLSRVNRTLPDFERGAGVGRRPSLVRVD
ncbi:FUSC family protein [Tomitella biformata]|uniref:FUSC family protein n=1 Tax=Tomitella biformata TaxID=630403 RepID=UPI000464B72B|nr:FUSC family protein [Tomitella biformata]